jgi:ribosomal protein S18 acetylase RimI-like enzyme
VTSDVITRPARKSDASDIALLVNVATHGGIARSWAANEEAADTYDPIEIGRLQMLEDDDTFNWRNATMAETADGEIVGMLLGYREPDDARPLPSDPAPFMVPLLQLEAAAEGRWFISMLGVHIRWRGKGVGSRLLDVAEEKWPGTAARGLALIVEDVNEGARRLYQRHGFSVRTSRPMVRFPGSTAPGEDWLLMVKE